MFVRLLLSYSSFFVLFISSYTRSCSDICFTFPCLPCFFTFLVALSNRSIVSFLALLSLQSVMSPPFPQLFHSFHVCHLIPVIPFLPFFPVLPFPLPAYPSLGRLPPHAPEAQRLTLNTSLFIHISFFLFYQRRRP